MGKQKRPRQKAAAKMEAKKSASSDNAEMDVDSPDVPVSDKDSKGASFKHTKAKLENPLSKIDKRALRQRILMQKLVMGGSGTKSRSEGSIAGEESESDQETPVTSAALLKRLGTREKPKQNLKTKDRPIKKAHQRKKQYIHNVLKITTQMKKSSKDESNEDIAERVKNLVSKLQK